MPLTIYNTGNVLETFKLSIENLSFGSGSFCYNGTKINKITLDAFQYKEILLKIQPITHRIDTFSIKITSDYVSYKIIISYKEMFIIIVTGYMNDTLNQLNELDKIIETNLSRCLKWILDPIADYAIQNMKEAINAYNNGQINRAINKEQLVLSQVIMMNTIVKVAKSIGIINSTLAKELYNVITHIQDDLKISIEILKK